MRKWFFNLLIVCIFLLLSVSCDNNKIASGAISFKFSGQIDFNNEKIKTAGYTGSVFATDSEYPFIYGIELYDENEQRLFPEYKRESIDTHTFYYFNIEPGNYKIKAKIYDKDWHHLFTIKYGEDDLQPLSVNSGEVTLCELNDYDYSYISNPIYVTDSVDQSIFVRESVRSTYAGTDNYSTTFQIKKILDNAFNGTVITDVPKVLKDQPLEIIGASAFSNCTKLESFEIPSTIIMIGNSAFKGCTALKSVDLPVGGGIPYISDSCFRECNNLTAINIPASVQYIKANAFLNCSNLTSVELQLNSNIKEIGEFAFSGCSSLTSITLPDSLSYVSMGAFSLDVNLKTVTYSDGGKLTSFGAKAFKGCTNLTTVGSTPDVVTLPKDIKYIGYKTFEDCSSIKEVVIPNGVVEISDYAFKNCTSIKEITIPASVKCLCACVFDGCTSLEKIICEAEGPTSDWNDVWTGNIPSTCEIVWGGKN